MKTPDEYNVAYRLPEKVCWSHKIRLIVIFTHFFMRIFTLCLCVCILLELRVEVFDLARP